jgi:hypothetical protein
MHEEGHLLPNEAQEYSRANRIHVIVLGQAKRSKQKHHYLKKVTNEQSTEEPWIRFEKALLFDSASQLAEIVLNLFIL